MIKPILCLNVACTQVRISKDLQLEHIAKAGDCANKLVALHKAFVAPMLAAVKPPPELGQL